MHAVIQDRAVEAEVVLRRGSVADVILHAAEELDTERKLRRRNYVIQRVRGRIKKIFGTWKLSYGLRGTWWRGQAKAGLQVRLIAIAYNLRRAVTPLRPAVA